MATQEEKDAAKAKREAEARDAVLKDLADLNVTDLKGDESIADLKERLKTAKADAKASAKKDATSASVLNAQGGMIRTYSVEDHGKDFADLANEFSAHTPNSSVVLN